MKTWRVTSVHAFQLLQPYGDPNIQQHSHESVARERAFG